MDNAGYQETGGTVQASLVAICQSEGMGPPSMISSPHFVRDVHHHSGLTIRFPFFSKSDDEKSRHTMGLLKESETDEAEELKVICKGPRRLLVVCANPPKIAGDYYHVIVKETEDSNSEPKVEHSSSRGFISIEFKDLRPFTNYTITVNDFQHGVQVPVATAFAHTYPEAPDPVLSPSSTTESITIKFTRGEDERPGIFSYFATGYKGGYSLESEQISGQCNQLANECTFEHLSPNTGYEFEFFRCSTAKPTLCSSPSQRRGQFYTLPEKPRDLRVKPLENRALACEWNTEDDNYEVDAYEIDLFTVNDSQPLQNLTLPAKVHFAMFKDLPSHTEFLVKLRSCFFDEHSESNLCSEPITALALTNPDPAKFEIVERTASSIVFGLVGPVNTSHFNYTLWVSNSTSRVSFDSQNHTFTALALSANSMVTASLVTCCKHNICSTPFKVDAFTKSKDSQFYIAAALPSFLGFLLLFLFLIAFLFRQRILRLARLMCNKQEKTDMSKS
ncbi:hypothetical protein Aperf_G00000013636 [Anoplocephala perfoliata]